MANISAALLLGWSIYVSAELIADAIALRGCEEVCIATHMGDK